MKPTSQKIAFFLLASSLLFNSFAASKFSFVGGINYNIFSDRSNDYISGSRAFGPTFGISFRPGNIWSPNFNILYIAKRESYEISHTSYDASADTIVTANDPYTVITSFKYLEIPIQLDFRPRTVSSSVHPFYQIGLSPSILLNAKNYIKEDAQFDTDLTKDFNRLDLGFNSGLGCAIDVGRGQLSVGLMGNIGLIDMAKSANKVAYDIENFYSNRTVSLLIGYSFAQKPNSK